MQCVILAAGRGTRMKELTKDKPKALLEVRGKTLIEHKFDALPREVDEIIIVVGHFGQVVQERYGEEYKGKKIRYVVQEKLNGTGGALWAAQYTLSNRFLVMMDDDLYSREDIKRCLVPPDGWVQLVQESDKPRSGGNVEFDENDNILAITEGEHNGHGYIGTNLYVLDTRIFDFPKIPKVAGSPEYGLPQTVLAASKVSGVSFRAVKASFWIQITDPSDLQKAEETLANLAK